MGIHVTNVADPRLSGASGPDTIDLRVEIGKMIDDMQIWIREFKAKTMNSVQNAYNSAIQALENYKKSPLRIPRSYKKRLLHLSELDKSSKMLKIN